MAKGKRDHVENYSGVTFLIRDNFFLSSVYLGTKTFRHHSRVRKGNN